MGTVFEAVNLAIERQVAVKVLHTSQLRHRDAVRRFHREARAAGSIGHPNICEVYDLGTLPDGRPYLVMEKLVGATLAEQIAKEGALPIDQVVDILMQVLSALVAAHGKGIVHRDIKPENVFLTQRVGCAPIAKLLDFGVSKMTRLPSPTDKENEVTRTGVILGTPYYLAPEQACAERHPDARIDLYACGVVLYEALTGQRPFTADSYHALLIKILTGKPRPARQLRPSLPEAFDPILEKAMARKREERYQTAVEFQNDLQRCADTAGSGPLPQFPADSDEVPTVVAVPPSLRAPPKAAPESSPELSEHSEEVRRSRH
jgi:serine/threonine protein kinase